MVHGIKVNYLMMKKTFAFATLLIMLFSPQSIAQNVAAGEGINRLFLQAQEAAQQSDFAGVVNVLTQLLDEYELSPEYTLLALSNRGVAYSHLEEFKLAQRDLLAAIDISPQHPLSRNQLGVIAENHAGEFEEAAIWYRLAAEQGYPPSQANLAALYWQGKGIERDENLAFELYSSALLQGYNLALTPLGEIHLDEESGFYDPDLAVDFLRKSAEYADATALYYLAEMYENGVHLARDSAAALAHYERAAVAGHPEAQNWLGYRYRSGRGVTQDYTLAVQWYELAAEQGHAQATNRLAWLLATCPRALICDGERALTLVSDLYEVDDSASVLDTLAAAYARVGDFENAVATQEKTLEIRSNAGYSARLRQYRAGNPHTIR